MDDTSNLDIAIQHLRECMKPTTLKNKCRKRLYDAFFVGEPNNRSSCITRWLLLTDRTPPIPDNLCTLLEFHPVLHAINISETRSKLAAAAAREIANYQQDIAAGRSASMWTIPQHPVGCPVAEQCILGVEKGFHIRVYINTNKPDAYVVAPMDASTTRVHNVDVYLLSYALPAKSAMFTPWAHVVAPDDPADTANLPRVLTASCIIPNEIIVAPPFIYKDGVIYPQLGCQLKYDSDALRYR